MQHQISWKLFAPDWWLAWRIVVCSVVFGIVSSAHLIIRWIGLRAAYRNILSHHPPLRFKIPRMEHHQPRVLFACCCQSTKQRARKATNFVDSLEIGPNTVKFIDNRQENSKLDFQLRTSIRVWICLCMLLHALISFWRWNLSKPLSGSTQVAHKVSTLVSSCQN